MSATALQILDDEIEVISQSLSRYRSRADRTAARKGERDIHADRVCDWAEYRRDRLRAARAEIARLIACTQHATEGATA
ncbi:hypothetical protein [Stenotrophomonas sepilia]|uniref:hypothetical protein n=1 Tax=Stenotrophomonas sepilia TaxID=2860290 RepID=UPI002E78ED92|nr:hypothetical protein [Stenotrophomonas sepilia]